MTRRILSHNVQKEAIAFPNFPERNLVISTKKPERSEQQHFPRVFAGVFAIVRCRNQLFVTLVIVRSSKIILRASKGIRASASRIYSLIYLPSTDYSA